jgi:hypothetical protein
MSGNGVLEQRAVGKQRGCDVHVGRATGLGQQAVVVRPGRQLSVGSTRRNGEQGALQAVRDRHANDLGAADDPLARLSPSARVLGDISIDPSTRRARYAGNFAPMVRSSA